MTAPVARRPSSHCTCRSRPPARALNSRGSTCADPSSAGVRTVAVIFILWTSGPAAAACRSSGSSRFRADGISISCCRSCRQGTGGGKAPAGPAGLHAAGGRLPACTRPVAACSFPGFLRVPGRRHACRKHSGERTPRGRTVLERAPGPQKADVLPCRHPTPAGHMAQGAKAVTQCPALRRQVGQRGTGKRVSCSGVSVQTTLMMVSANTSRIQAIHGHEQTEAVLPLDQYEVGCCRKIVVCATGHRAWSNPLWSQQSPGSTTSGN